MINKEKNHPRHCLFCEKPIETHSRPEKLYCNVNCKNNYNSRKKAELKSQASPHQAEILKIIKNNYQILLKYKQENNDLKHIEVNKQDLIDKGFIPNFFTSSCQAPDQRLWNCCFDICVMESGDKKYNLSYRPINFYTDEDEHGKVTITQE